MSIEVIEATEVFRTTQILKIDNLIPYLDVFRKIFFKQTPGILVKFCHPSDLRLWRAGMLLLTKTTGHMSNVHYSGFQKHLQTKSNLHISISQSKLKHKCLPLDTL